MGTEARGRTVDGEVVPTPWQGRFWNYDERGGMWVPLDGEVAWLLPEGAKPYWRGRITEITTSSRGDRGSVPTGLGSPRAYFEGGFPQRPSEQQANCPKGW